jgi:DNA-binding LacI/PurR family transcriptional regulator
MGHPTMEDVARRAGVSRALVSLVMNDSPKVSQQRRALVLEAAAALGYRRNDVARRLASRRTGTVGVMLNDLHNPFFAEIYDGIELGADRAGKRPLLTTASRRVAGERNAIEAMLEQRVEGMILVSPRLPASELLAAGRIVPVVVVGRLVRGGVVDVVTNHERHGAQLAVRHLFDLGHRSITHIDGGAGAGARARRSGYERAMRGLDLAPDVMAGDFTELAGANAVRALLQRKRLPTAIFAANDLVAAGAMDALEDVGLVAPDDLSIVGHDNTFLARLHHVSLSSIDQSAEEMGRTAMTLLQNRVNGAQDDTVVHLVTPRLIERRTTGPPPSAR